MSKTNLAQFADDVTHFALPNPARRGHDLPNKNMVNHGANSESEYGRN